MQQGDKDLQAIEDLSQQLVEDQQMEQIRRQNLLFDTYLKKMESLSSKDEDPEAARKKKKQRSSEKKVPTLTPEEKFAIAQEQAERLKGVIEECVVKSDTALQTLRAILEETDMSIAQIRKDAYDFQRQILLGGQNSRTGKIEAQRIQKYFEEKKRQKENLIKKYKTKKDMLWANITKTQKQIEKKEVQGDQLKFIDFHQLQIENKKYAKEIEEKNKKLLHLKIVSGKIGSELLRKKKELQDATQKIEEANMKIKDTQIQIQKGKKQHTELSKDFKKKVQETKKLKSQSEQMINSKSTIPDTLDYVDQKTLEEQLLYKKKNLERKIMIATDKYNKAKKELH